MPKAQPKEPTFSELLEQHQLQMPLSLDQEIDKTLLGLDTLVRRSAFHEGEEQYQTSVSNLIERYFSLEFARKYQPHSAELLDLGRTITIPNHGRDNEVVRIPLFVTANLLERKWSKEYVNNSREKVVMNVDTPRLPPSVADHAREALSYVAEVTSRAYTKPVLGDLLAFTTRKLPLPDGKLQILWIPRDEDLRIEVQRIPDPDPALMLSYKDTLFLVDKWNTKDEKPFEHYLREYAGMGSIALQRKHTMK